MANASPGWYDDGSGRRRWWTGSAWSDSFLDERAQSDGGIQSDPEAGRRASWSRAKIAIVGTGVVIVLGAVAAGVGAAASGGSPAAEQKEIHGLISSPVDSPSATPTPAVLREVKTVDEKTVVPFASSTVDDPSLAAGTTAIATQGVDGEKVTTYEVTYENGIEISRRVVKETVSVAPIDEVVSNGTYVAPPPPPPVSDGCDPNYAGACVPIASDVDCAGGSGNGPAYVQGPVRIVGRDIYDLDRDGDGIACDR